MSKRSYKQGLHTNKVVVMEFRETRKEAKPTKMFTVRLEEKCPENEFLELKKLDITPQKNSEGEVLVRATDADIALDLGFNYYTSFHSLQRTELECFKAKVYSAS